MGTTHMLNGWMDKENVVDKFSGIFVVEWKEILPFSITWMDLKGIISVKFKETKTNASSH